MGLYALLVCRHYNVFSSAASFALRQSRVDLMTFQTIDFNVRTSIELAVRNYHL